MGAPTSITLARRRLRAGIVAQARMCEEECRKAFRCKAVGLTASRSMHLKSATHHSENAFHWAKELAQAETAEKEMSDFLGQAYLDWAGRASHGGCG